MSALFKKNKIKGKSIVHFRQQQLSTQRCTHQEAIEEFMDKETQHANQDICHMVEKGHVQDDCPVPSGERATVSNKTHQKYYFITKLKSGGEKKKRSYCFIYPQMHINNILTKPIVHKSVVLFCDFSFCNFSALLTNLPCKHGAGRTGILCSSRKREEHD